MHRRDLLIGAAAQLERAVVDAYRTCDSFE